MHYIHNNEQLVYKQQLKRNKNNLTDLNWLRLRIVFVLNLTFTILLLPSIWVELQSGDFNSVGISIISVSALVISNILIAKGYLNLPIYITVVLLPIFGFIIAFMDAVPYQAMFPQLSLLLGLCIWILNHYYFRIVYTLAYLAGLFILYYSHNPFVESSTHMLIILDYISVFYMLTLFIEKQESKLANSLNTQKLLNSTLKDRNKTLNTFSHIMSHDLKAPLRNTVSFIQLIRKKFQFENEKQKQYFQIIEDSTKEMKVLIDELLLYQKVESEAITFESIELKNLISELSSNIQKGPLNKKLQIDISTLPKINGNSILLKALFSNLISNSIKFQPKEKDNHTPIIKIWSNENMPKYFEIFISDNGIGIQEEYINNLFQPFKRYHSKKEYEGTGLGMSICKSVMERHSGFIELSKTSSSGCTFKLTFPKMKPPNQADGHDPSSPR